MIQNGFLSISTGRLGNCKHSKLADNDKFYVQFHAIICFAKV